MWKHQLCRSLNLLNLIFGFIWSSGCVGELKTENCALHIPRIRWVKVLNNIMGWRECLCEWSGVTKLLYIFLCLCLIVLLLIVHFWRSLVRLIRCWVILRNVNFMTNMVKKICRSKCAIGNAALTYFIRLFIERASICSWPLLSFKLFLSYFVLKSFLQKLVRRS